MFSLTHTHAHAQNASRAHGVSPALLRQAMHVLNKKPTRQRNALDLIVWKNHERAKWLRWGASCSPFQNTFFKKVRDTNGAGRGGGDRG